MVRDGFFYALGFGVVAALLWKLTHSYALLSAPLLLAAFFLWFFRDPNRQIPSEPGQIVSPGDGVVTNAEWIETVNGSRLRLSIFLNVFDVHVNRTPIPGRVVDIRYQEGQFLVASKEEASHSNEQNTIVVEGTIAGEPTRIAFKQIAGLIARRIVCYKKPGDILAPGERVGLIKFGSRVDVLLEASARVNVKVGDRVKGGSSVLAYLSQQPALTVAGNVASEKVRG